MDELAKEMAKRVAWTLENVEGLHSKTRERLNFYAKQFYGIVMGALERDYTAEESKTLAELQKKIDMLEDLNSVVEEVKRMLNEEKAELEGRW